MPLLSSLISSQLLGCCTAFEVGDGAERGCPAFFLGAREHEHTSALVHPYAIHTAVITGSTMTELDVLPCEPQTIQGCGAGNSVQHPWRSSTSTIMTLVSIVSVLLVRGSSSTASASATPAAPAGVGGSRGHCWSSGGSCSKGIEDFAGWWLGSKRQLTSRSSGRRTATASATDESGRSRESRVGGVLAGGPVDTDCDDYGECTAEDHEYQSRHV